MYSATNCDYPSVCTQRASTKRLTGESPMFLRVCGRLGPQTVKVLLALGTYHPFHPRFFLRMHVVHQPAQLD